ncbi:uncharacterized protein L3040_003058 [Drepanopeziza brunnea f. sp. 'multigermtubi']|nr:hypothetical protein L3040_003058 [Drepanopeziza brunnea f. sp. 'multigermtubi']
MSLDDLQLQRSAQNPMSQNISPRLLQDGGPGSSSVSELEKAPSLRRPQKVVTVIVGPEDTKETYIIHKGIICYYSPFFNAAFNGNFAEGETQTMRLDDVNSETFGLLVDYLYTQQIDVDPKDYDGNIIPLAQLWVIAGRFFMPALQNKIMNELRTMVEWAEEEGLRKFMHFAYEASVERTPLKSLATDMMAWMTPAAGLQIWITKGYLPDGMMADIIMSLKKDHIFGAKPTRKFGVLGRAKEYYVRVGEEAAAPKQEK